jgi:hypothetical protein
MDGLGSGLPRAIGPGDRQLLQAIQHHFVAKRQGVDGAGQCEGRQLLEKAAKDNFQLGTGEMGADTLMQTMTKAQVIPGFTVDIDLVGLRVDQFVPIT